MLLGLSSPPLTSKLSHNNLTISTYCLKGQLNEVNTITLLRNDGIMKSESITEDGRIEFVLPADREYSTSFELNTTCGVMSNVSSITFSETFNVGTCTGWVFTYSAVR